ncbi:UDP-D-xylose:L-fucose alpha-1,3-D-xylosyltransferase 3-like [Acanthaster planci]|uniref:UDP-D-xylose:L-fucose alpha-1,3-D-xylosyltransferase 3-like n=1 Tax=Acanthaster planci TaxID=133434 RepID=A0A8B7XQZ1_ACAPL|nr:UDP-D-xylose:L-fucose alpha-1,3-D-xylosyltransferase 3-like [Acanthaster planci]XP_022082416.1 UDP-D-xylose:L-fucose alpha-1,3-D-xylosyltransferase 3-like [Acanthaster planci]XP_022082417.1 UDP-D-xylose:L-fucose alpha-1,3-D-xylosyltransferase 3-like [Acanthaster planci]
MDRTRVGVALLIIFQFPSILFAVYHFCTRNTEVLDEHRNEGKIVRVEHIQVTEPRVGIPNSRGDISGCTLADIRMRPGVMLLVNTNTGYMDMTLNLLESIKRTGVCVNTTIVAEEEKAYQTMLSHAQGDPAIKVVKTDQGEADPGKLVLYSREYRRLVNRRHRYILSLLEKGYEVFFTDVDTFWFQDPFSYFQGEFDMALVDERSPYPTRLQKKSLHCAGLVYFKPTKKTLQFVKKWIQILADPKNKVSDQGVLNRMMHDDIPVRVDVRQLPVKYFPHALVFYKPEWRKENNDPIIMHNVGVRGHDAKAKKFRENNMWLVKTTSGTV